MKIKHILAITILSAISHTTLATADNNQARDTAIQACHSTYKDNTEKVKACVKQQKSAAQTEINTDKMYAALTACSQSSPNSIGSCMKQKGFKPMSNKNSEKK